MKKPFLYTLAALAVLFFCQSVPAEARHHYQRNNAQVQLNIGNGPGYREGYVVRRYIAAVPRPAAPIAYYPAVPYATPVYAAPSPLYVEEVYVAPVRRPLTFAGLSLSWNFFR
jgi:hypothetical protein